MGDLSGFNAPEYQWVMIITIPRHPSISKDIDNVEGVFAAI